MVPPDWVTKNPLDPTVAPTLKELTVPVGVYIVIVGAALITTGNVTDSEKYPAPFEMASLQPVESLEAGTTF